MERVQIFILAEGLKIEYFGSIRLKKNSLVQTFCESCEQLDITHPSVHMTRRFVIQGCPTLTDSHNYYITVHRHTTTTYTLTPFHTHHSRIMRMLHFISNYFHDCTLVQAITELNIIRGLGSLVIKYAVATTL